MFFNTSLMSWVSDWWGRRIFLKMDSQKTWDHLALGYPQKRLDASALTCQPECLKKSSSLSAESSACETNQVESQSGTQEPQLHQSSQYPPLKNCFRIILVTFRHEKDSVKNRNKGGVQNKRVGNPVLPIYQVLKTPSSSPDIKNTVDRKCRMIVNESGGWREASGPAKWAFWNRLNLRSMKHGMNIHRPG